VDLCFQGYQKELASLPGAYAPPRGRLLLATEAGQPAGCVALRPFAESTCEIKRLFVKPQYQGRGLGRALAQQIIAEGRLAGYSAIVLDTLPRMQTAIHLYQTLGFRGRSAYYETPLQDTVFMELRL
jgi:ribosomal protein S18 acetylase RimI-like enzyme